MRWLVICFFLTFTHAQTDLDIFFDPPEIDTLERLIVEAENHDLAVQQALVNLNREEASLETFSRLTDSLTITGGAGVEGDFYGQASPNYNISISLDLIKLIEVDDDRSVLRVALDAAKRDCRTRVVDAFIAYKVAVESAEAASLALEGAEANLEIVEARVKIGEATQGELVSQKKNVEDAAVRLLQANGQIISTLEHLASAVGIPPAKVLAEVVKGLEESGKGKANR